MNTKAIPAAVLLMAVLPLFAQEKHDLVYRFDPGEKVVYRITLNSLDTQKFESYPPQEINTTLEMHIGIQADTAVSESDLNLTATFEKVDITVRTGGQAHYPMTDVMIGKSVRLHTSEKGKLDNMVGRDFLPRVQMVPTDPSGQNLGDFLKDLLHRLPEQPAGKGDKWEITETDTTKDMGRETVSVTVASFELKNIKEKGGMKQAEISGRLKVKATVTGNVMGGKFVYNGDGSGKLDYVWDLDRNLMVEKKLRLTMDGIFEISGAQSGTGTMSSDSDIVFRLEK